MKIRKSCKVLMVIIKVRENLGNLDGDGIKTIKLILRRCNV